MPLRDHFRPPLSEARYWDGFHGMWPATIVLALNRHLPPQYAAEPRVHLGADFEIDVAAYEADAPGSVTASPADQDGGVATVTWAPPRPSVDVTTDGPDQDEYEVLVINRRGTSRVVAAVEIVSPANKDRPETRRAFVTKCAELLRRGISVAVVDLVTTRHANLYLDLLDQLGQSDQSFAPGPQPLYAAACRWHRNEASRAGDNRRWRFEAWSNALAVGEPLPTLPLWLSDGLAVPLELEATYQDTWRALRLP